MNNSHSLTPQFDAVWADLPDKQVINIVYDRLNGFICHVLTPDQPDPSCCTLQELYPSHVYDEMCHKQVKALSQLGNYHFSLTPPLHLVTMPRVLSDITDLELTHDDH